VRKIHLTGEMLNVDDRMDALLEVCRQTPDLVAAYLFGSYGTEYQTPLSDVDLAFVFRLGHEPDADAEMEFRGRVLDALQEEDVSIVLLNRVPCIFQMKVLRTGRRLYCGDEIALADFVERVVNVHGDYIIHHQKVVAEYDAALREEYGRG
jgi:uncharacterized protein